MHDRTNKQNEGSSSNSDPRKRDHAQWVNKYLELADTALQQKGEEQEPAA